MADTEFDPSAQPGTAEYDHRRTAVSTSPEIAEDISHGMDEAPAAVVEEEVSVPTLGDFRDEPGPEDAPAVSGTEDAPDEPGPGEE